MSLSLVVLLMGAGCAYASTVVHRVKLNGEVAYLLPKAPPAAFLNGHDEGTTPALMEMPFTATKLLMETTELLGVVGPLTVQWAFAIEDALDEATGSSTNSSGGSTVLPSTTYISVGEPNKPPLIAVEVSPTTRSWCWAGVELTPHVSYILRVGAATVLFRAGPHGTAGVASTGWTAAWTGGANAIHAAVDMAPALQREVGERITTLTLYSALL
jgi:hypothetical protein